MIAGAALERPEDMPEAFAAAWHERDGSAIAALFADDADFVNVVGIWWEDRASIARAHDYALGSFFRYTTLKVGRTKVRRLGDTAAIVHARMILTGQTSPRGEAAGRRNTLLTFAMERRTDGWVCVAAQNTEIIPGTETFEARDGGLTARGYRTT